MVFLVYKEVDFFVCSVCKAVCEICSMWIRIFNFIFYVDVIQFIFGFFYAILACELFVKIDEKENLLINRLVSLFLSFTISEC